MLFLILIMSYLIGSVPFGYILVRIFQGKDVRESGSGNIGATNVARSSPALGLVTLLLDAGKGSAAVANAVLWVGHWDAVYPHRPIQTAACAALAAFVAVIGHMFPVWLKFRGGKGVATAFGSLALIAPKAILLAIGVFVVTLIVFRYVSLSSILAVTSFPVQVWLLHEHHDQASVLAVIAACSFIIVLRHHANIGRLLRGTEPRFRARHS